MPTHAHTCPHMPTHAHVYCQQKSLLTIFKLNKCKNPEADGVLVKAKLYAISSDTPITVYETAPFQTRKILIDLVMSW